MDASDPCSYYWITNFSVISRLLERTENYLLSSNPSSAHRSYHLIEAAILPNMVRHPDGCRQRLHSVARTSRYVGRIDEADISRVSWMRSNRLKLSTEQTEVLWCTTLVGNYVSYLGLQPRIGLTAMSTASTVRDLGIYLDADLSTRSHVQQTVSKCFEMLRQLGSVRR